MNPPNWKLFIAFLVILAMPTTAEVFGWPLTSQKRGTNNKNNKEQEKPWKRSFFEWIWSDTALQAPNDDIGKLRQQILLYAPSVISRSTDPTFKEPYTSFKRKRSTKSHSERRKTKKLRRRRRLKPGVDASMLEEYGIVLDKDGWEYLDNQEDTPHSLSSYNEDRLYGAPTLDNEWAFVRGLGVVAGQENILSRTAKILKHSFVDDEEEVNVFLDLDPLGHVKVGRWTHYALSIPSGGLATRYSLIGSWEELMDTMGLSGEGVPDVMLSKKSENRVSRHMDSFVAPPIWPMWLRNIKIEFVRAPNIFAQAAPETWSKPVSWSMEPQITLGMVGIHVQVEMLRYNNQSLVPEHARMVLQSACDLLDWLSPEIVGNDTKGNNLQICCGCTMKTRNENIIDLLRLSLIHRGAETDVYYGFTPTAQVPLDPSVLSTYGLPIHPAGKDLNQFASTKESVEVQAKKMSIDPELFFYDYEPDLTHDDVLQKLRKIVETAQNDKPDPSYKPRTGENQAKVALKGRLLTKQEDEEFWSLVEQLQENPEAAGEAHEEISTDNSTDSTQRINLLSALLQSPLRDQCFDSHSGIHSIYASLSLDSDGMSFVEYIRSGKSPLAAWNPNFAKLTKSNEAHIPMSNADYIASGLNMLNGPENAFAIRSGCVGDNGLVASIFDIDERELARQAEEARQREIREAEQRAKELAEKEAPLLEGEKTGHQPLEKPLEKPVEKPVEQAEPLQVRVKRSLPDEQEDQDDQEHEGEPEEHDEEEDVEVFDPTVPWKQHVDISMTRLLPPSSISDSQELQAPSPCVMPPPNLNITTRIDYPTKQPQGFVESIVANIKGFLFGKEDGVGFHPTMIVEWDVPESIPKYIPVLYLILQLEPGLFPDIYQLETYKSTGRYLGVWTWGSSDLESPVDAGTSIGYGGIGLAVRLEKGQVQIPLHVRYQEPGDELYTKTRIPSPMVFVRIHPKHRNIQGKVGCLLGPAVLPVIAPLARLVDIVRNKPLAASDPLRLFTDPPYLTQYDLSHRQGLGLVPLPNFAVGQRPDFSKLKSKITAKEHQEQPFNLDLESWLDTFVLHLPTGQSRHGLWITLFTLTAMLFGASWIVDVTNNIVQKR